MFQLWQLETLLLQKDTYMNYSRALSFTSQALSQNLQGIRQRSPIKRLGTKVLYFLRENWRRIWVLTLWIMIMVGLFIWKFFQYKHKNAFRIMGYCLTTAKGAAETLKFNMALILLPVCRNTITWLRKTKIGYYVPFDDNINFHKVHADPRHSHLSFKSLNISYRITRISPEISKKATKSVFFFYSILSFFK